MKSIRINMILSVLFTFFMLSLCSATIENKENPVQDIDVIPRPEEYVLMPGQFDLTGQLMFYINAPELKSIADYTLEKIESLNGLYLSFTDKEERTINKRTISLEISPLLETGEEGYKLECSPEKVLIKAAAPQGIFYGAQTLLQLIASGEKLQIPCVSIKDTPRFPWRGLMLDVSRHFFTIGNIKQVIDQMAMYKFNTLHLHLTDDQGWRLEIKSLPELTEYGAWRVPRTGPWWEREPPREGEAATYGGFYTQEQIKELIRYADSQFIRILPEIDVPGHSLAAIATFPYLSCTKKKYKVNPGSAFMGVEDNALCAGQEATYDFLEKIFTEVAGLFPFEYIHIGGDECFRIFWENCDVCKKMMEDNHLSDSKELQSYFIKRLEKMLKTKGKKLIGWDEIVEGGLAPEATVMSWRGMENGIKAAKAGHHVIMTPMNYTYLDLYQGDPAVEPPAYQMLRLKDAFSFDPVPQGVDSSFILGGQGNLWSERVTTIRHAEYMFWPRSFALSEVLWSPKEGKNWDDFIRRTEDHLKRLDQLDINHSVSFYDAIIKPFKQNGKLKIRLGTEISGLDIYYTFDNTYPGIQYRENEILSVPRKADTFRVITIKDGNQIGKMITVSIQELKERTKINWIN